MSSSDYCSPGTNCSASPTDLIDDVAGNYTRRSGFDVWTGISAIMYGVICLVGLIGNGLVIYVVLMYAKMKTVTNMYILNLAIADICFIVGLPFLIATSVLRNWVFGFTMCKIFYILTSINWFTSVFTLTVMSADRYLAVCHPIKSMRYRTPLVSRVVCVCVWILSLLVMLPIVLYATTLEGPGGRASCTISWPDGQLISADKAFIWYALLLGFAIPVALIVVFYTLVVIRLKSVGPKQKSKEKKKSHRKVTKMVLTVITVYVICWLPYWVFQVALTFATAEVPLWCVQLFQIITVMSYANSTLNPVLYAFLSENFRKSFIQAFKCAKAADVNAALHTEHSVFPGRRSVGNNVTTPIMHGNGGGKMKGSECLSNEEIEFQTTNVTSSTKYDTSFPGEESKAMIVNHDGFEAETAIANEPIAGSL